MSINVLKKTNGSSRITNVVGQCCMFALYIRKSGQVIPIVNGPEFKTLIDSPKGDLDSFFQPGVFNKIYISNG